MGTLALRDLTLENFSSHLIKKSMALQSDNGGERAAAAISGCKLCSKPGYELGALCINPLKFEQEFEYFHGTVAKKIIKRSEKIKRVGSRATVARKWTN